MNQMVFVPRVRTGIIFAVIAIILLGSARAAVDFRLVGGQRIYDKGSHICLDIISSSATKVTFILWSQIPEPITSIVNVQFDTGRHTNLFTDISVVTQSPDGTIAKTRPSGHAYLPKFTPDFAFSKVGTTLYHPGGINRGDMLMLSASLGSGKTSSDVIAALNEGSNPATETLGLRVGLVVHHLKGKRRDPNVTEGDDAGFVTKGLSTRCQRG